MRRHLRAAGAYAVLALLLTWPLAAHFTSAVPGVPGDNWQQYWNVWWVKRALLELHQSPYHTAVLFHPTGAELHLHALNLVPVLLVLPLAAAFGLTVAYNALALLSFVLGGHGAYRLCLAAAFRGRAARAPAAVHLAAFLGGTVFTFSAYHFFYLQGPMALASVQWLPYFAWQLLEAGRRPGVRAPLLAAFFFACAALTDWFHALSLLLFALGFVAWHAFAHRDRKALVRMGLALAVGLIALAPVLVPALALAGASPRPPDPVASAAGLSGDLLGFLVPSPLHPFWPGRWASVYAGLPGKGALTTFVGFVPLALAAVAARRVGRRFRFWLAGAAFFALLSLGPILQVAGRALPVPLPAALFYRLPVTDLLRSPARFVGLASMCLAVAATGGVIALLRRARVRPHARWLVAALAAGALLENLPAPYPLSPVAVSAVYDAIAREPGDGAVLELPPGPGGLVPERMLHQTRHGKPVLGGYPARGGPRFGWETRPGFRELQALEPLSADGDIVGADPPGAAGVVLARYGVQTLVIGKARAAPEVVARAREVVATLWPGLAPLADDAAVLAYRLPEPEASPSFLHLEASGGWQSLEPLSLPPPGFPARFRWMDERGRLALHAAQDGSWRVELRGWAFARPRRLALLVDGRSAGETLIANRPDAYALAPFTVAEGWHGLELRSLDGAEAPANGDARRLSVAAAEIRLQPLPPWTEGARLALGAPAADPYLGEGWSRPEGAFRWTDGLRATLFVPRATGAAALLRLRVRPFVAAPGRPAQRLRLEADGRALGEVTLGGPATLRVVLEAAAGRGVQTLALHLPDAASPPSPGPGADARALGVAVEWVALEAPPRVGEPGPQVQAGWLAVEGAGSALAPPWPLVTAFTLDPPAPLRLEAALRFADAARVPPLSVWVNGREVERGQAAAPRLVLALPPEKEAARTVLAIAPREDAARGEGSATVLTHLTLRPAPSLPLADAVSLPSPRAEAYLGRGWSEGEGTRRWTDGPRADLILGAGDPAILRMGLRPFLVPGRLERQRVAVEQDRARVAEISLDGASPLVQAVALPRRAAPGVVVLALPDAASPASLGVGSDRRRLGVTGEWVRVDPFPRLRMDAMLAVGAPAAQPFLGNGWSHDEGAFRWTDGPVAELFLDPPAHRGALLELTMRGFVAPPAIPRQRVEVRTGDRVLGTLDLTDPDVITRSLPVPAGALAGPSVLRFSLPDAVRPAEKGLGAETRRLGLALHSLRLRPVSALMPQLRLLLGGPDAGAYLGSGWGQAEGEMRWTDGPRAELFFDLREARPRVLQLRLRPLVTEGIPRQRVGLRLNGREITTLTLTDPTPAVYAVAIPPDAYAAQNHLELRLPDAVALSSLSAGSDSRRLGVAVFWIRFAPWF